MEFELSEAGLLRHLVLEYLDTLNRDIAKYERRSWELEIDDFQTKIASLEYRKQLMINSDKKLVKYIGEKSISLISDH